MRWASGVVCIAALLIVPALARAQAPAHDATERAAIDAQLDVVAGLWVAGAIAGAVGAVTLPVGLIGVANASLEGDTDGLVALMVGGSVVLPIGVILLGFAIGLHVDAEVRRGTLGPRAALAAGPGELGLAIAVTF